MANPASDFASFDDARFASFGPTRQVTASYTYEEARALGIKFDAPDVSRAPTNQDPNTGSRQKNIDSQKALKLIPYEKLDEAQGYANAGDTMPIVFCNRADNRGGVWLSPPIIDSAVQNFESTFIYLLSYGKMYAPLGNLDYYYLGKNNLKDWERRGLGTNLTIGSLYTSNPATCPLNGYTVGCLHNVFKLILDPLEPSIGSSVQFRSIDDYSTEARIKVIPLYPKGVSSPTVLETYNIRVRRTNNNTGTTTTVGTITTSNNGTISALFTDTYSTGTYTHTFDIQSVATAAAVKPATILIEFRQENAFPDNLDRTASYANISLLAVVGNLYNPNEALTAPNELKQLHVFVEEGIWVDKWRTVTGTTDTSSGFTYANGPSRFFGDLALYFFDNSKKYPNVGNIQVLSIADVAIAAVFHENYKMFFNGIVSSSTNFMSYIQSLAPMFLCAFYMSAGLYSLTPLLPITSTGLINVGALTPKETFNDTETAPNTIDNSIIAGTYRKTYFDVEERLPFQVIVSWRGIRKTGMETTRTATVRYSDYASDVPEVEYDMTEFCTTKEHAITFSKYLLATKRYANHRITFQTARNTLDNSDLEPLDLIRVELNRVNSEGDSRTEIEHYLVDSIEYDQVTLATITATHFPLNEAGASIISNSIVSGSFEVIV